MDNDDLEAWLTEVDLVHKKIQQLSQNDVTIEQFDDQEKLLSEKKRKAEMERLQKQQREMEEKERKIRNGRKGKGEKKDYSNFCKHCFLEYERITLECFQCKRPTMTQEARYQELLGRVKQFQEDKNRKEQRKQKYELMQKTQKILWKKNSTNYNKWEYYTSSEEEIDKSNQEPIVPKDDPNFRALEMDMKQRQIKRQQDLKQAEDLRLKGNDYFKNGQFDHAVMKYTQALDIIKDVKSIWLNRALAYIKLNKFRKASNDCTKVLEYCECFENGYTVSKESCFKAFLRRATAQKMLQKLEQALEDINQALILFPQDQEARLLKSQIEEQIKYSLEVKDIKQNELPFKDVFDKFINQEDVSLSEVINAFKQPKARVYFFSNKGLVQIIHLIKSNQDEKKEQLIVLALQVFLEETQYYQEQLYLNYNGIQVIMDKLDQLLQKAKQNSVYYDYAQDYFDILNSMDEEKVRLIIQKDQTLIQKIYPQLFNELIQIAQREYRVVGSFISLCSNLCYGQTDLKTIISKDYKKFFEQVAFLLTIIKPTPQFQQLYNTLCNLLSNLLTDQKFRDKVIDDSAKELVYQKLIFFLGTPMSQENAIAVFVNLGFKADRPLQLYIHGLNIVPILLEFLSSQNQAVQQGAITVLGKTLYNENIFILNPFVNKYTISLRTLMNMVTIGPQDKILQQILQNKEEYFKLLESLKQNIHKDEEVCFCNTLSLLGQLIDVSPLNPVVGQENPSSYFHQIIPRLITVTRDKIGNIRKNAAIFLAKLSKEPKNLKAIRDLHGIEILNSVIGHLNI